MQLEINGLSADRTDILRQQREELLLIEQSFASQVARRVSREATGTRNELQDLEEEVRLRRELAGASEESARQAQISSEIRSLELRNQRLLEGLEIERQSVVDALDTPELADSEAEILQARLTSLQEEMGLRQELLQLSIAQLERDRESAEISRNSLAPIRARLSALREDQQLATLRAEVANTDPDARGADQALVAARRRLAIERERLQISVQRLLVEAQLADGEAAEALARDDVVGAEASSRKAESLRDQAVEYANLGNLAQRALEIEERRLAAISEGGFFDGFAVGLSDFVDQFEAIGTAGQRAAEGTVSAISSGTSGAILAAIRQDEAGIADALNSIFDGVAQSFVQSLVDFLLANLVDGIFGGAIDSLLSPTGSPVADVPNAAPDVIGGVAGVAQGASEATTLPLAAATASGILEAGIAAVATALVTAATTAAGILSAGSAASAAPGVLGALAGAGGGVPGMNKGGAVARLLGRSGNFRNVGRAPRGLHFSDKIQAFLGADEFVIRGDRVRQLGVQWLDNLNERGIIGLPNGAEGVLGSVAPIAAPSAVSGVVGRATGGSVAPAGGRSGGGGGDTTLAVLSRRELDRYNSGRSSPLRQFARREPRTLRSLLALD